MWGFLYLPLPRVWQINRCDVLCEYRDRGRWKWFVGKSTRSSEMTDVRFSMSRLGGREVMELRK